MSLFIISGVLARNSLILMDESEDDGYKQPEECDFDAMNFHLKCFWLDNWYLIAAGLVIPIISMVALNSQTGIFEKKLDPVIEESLGEYQLLGDSYHRMLWQEEVAIQQNRIMTDEVS